ncbi:deoxyguanosinetriphosphate triphosphohydrolase [Acidiphilium sp. AL]|uniref:Deoxyguanosinetriphosphate triphosphohydrolase-like protein n=1 Tax=Acidiphilium iwatense TaxID=768198 RepID=A0ABS9DWG4_9PROT|nr:MULTISPECIES: deoxyguanosinetriphosphate triphosphohydrolase [Acidiphilium]MCF3947077.1 deoxyguanosinetriphosphate triphosphohydrolase [Acidiphilium iwatense]MCU4160479.1 deoxyguanosinetriphosphate triphosphohydrolase [Acidiphilium sp. AL]
MSLAPYAVCAGASRGRQHLEPDSNTRSPFQRDRDRVLHSNAFRKLQYKTQVFVIHEGDFYRTRLTHSLEVAQIARSIARSLGLDEDLTEALALAHDLGHPPFGHAGEAGLNAALDAHGGFDHNAQSLRSVTFLEHRYAGFDGLNLTWETLEGIAKHNGPVFDPPDYIARFDRDFPLDLARQASAEAQVAALADDIAYHAHDIDDGLRAGLFGLDDLAHLPVVGVALAEARGLTADPRRIRAQTVRQTIGVFVTGALAESRARLDVLAPESSDAIRNTDGPVIGFSADLAAANHAIREFLYARMYRHWRVNRMTHKVEAVVREMANLFLARPDLLRDDWRDRAGSPNSEAAAEAVRDYIAGMTDRFALDEHRRLTDPHSAA